MGSNNTTNNHTHDNSKDEKERRYMKELAKHILLLATLVATVTYAAGFCPPGGVWEYNSGHLAGDPVIMSTQYARYSMFFYCNAMAFTSSLLVLVLVLLLCSIRRQDNLRIIVIPLVLVMLVGLLSLVIAYAAGTYQNTFTAIYTSLLVAAVFVYVVIEWVLAYLQDKSIGVARNGRERRLCEVLMQLATFALTVTYTGGLSTPGGFWDSTEGGNRPGQPILKGARLTGFFVCNTTAFVASLLTVVILLVRKISRTIRAAFVASVIMLFGLLGSYVAGTSWGTDAAIYLGGLIGAIMVHIILQQVVVWGKLRDVSRLLFNETMTRDARVERKERAYSRYIQLFLATLALTITFQAGLHPPGGLWKDNAADGHKAGDPILRTTNPRRYNAFFYCNSVAFVASLVCMILVQIRPLLKHRALEQAMILDLLGLVGAYAIGSCREETTTVYAMGIGGAALVYVVLHVVLVDDRGNHGRRKDEDDRSLNSMGYALFLFAIFVATITYQAGLTPPGGFLLKADESGNHAGDPVLLHNYPRRYRVFFFCNSTSFMVSIAVIILLVNENLYRPAMRTHALSICTLASFVCLIIAFAAGTTQHLKTSIYTLALLAVVLIVAILLLLLFFLRSVIYPVPSALPALTDDAGQPIDPIPITLEEKEQAVTEDAGPPIIGPVPINSEENNGQAAADGPIELIPITVEQNNGQDHAVADLISEQIVRRTRADQIYMMTVGILVASVTYQAGLDPPGGSWQGSSDGHNAGDPVMHDNRRQRYLAFFYSNSTSFVTSICLMILVLPKSMPSLAHNKLMSRALYSMIMLGFLGLLGAYSAGSSRDWKTSMHVVAIVFSVLAYFSIHVMVSLLCHKGGGNEPQTPEPTNSPVGQAIS